MNFGGLYMKDRIAVSIVVAIYNAAPYLRKCLDSVVNQTLRNVEIIFIDDGSTDGSSEICKESASKDSRIIYYKKENEAIKKKNIQIWMFFLAGASDEARTRYLHLGKVALYQMSYTRKWCPGPESNQRHVDFQSTALPTALPGQMWRRGRDLNPRPPA